TGTAAGRGPPGPPAAGAPLEGGGAEAPAAGMAPTPGVLSVGDLGMTGAGAGEELAPDLPLVGGVVVSAPSAFRPVCVSPSLSATGAAVGLAGLRMIIFFSTSAAVPA